MALADDNATGGLDVGTIARRGAALCAAAERAFAQLKKNNPRAIHPLYVIGSEVPVPGGASKEDDGIRITAANDFINTVEIFKKAYREAGLESAWENVIAVVVQPGVEFGNWNVHEYDRQAASELCMTLKKYPELVFEGHSTDYQTASSLRHMVEDGIAILKVGPALTFALREALFALNFIEEALLSENEEVMLSGFICKLEEVMLKNPKNWERHYRRGKLNAHYFRQYSYLDRCRYYLNDDEVRKSIEVLLGNLKCVDIPLPLLSQFMPKQYCKIRRRALANNPEELIKDRIKDSIDGYEYATSCNLEDSRPNNREVKN